MIFVDNVAVINTISQNPFENYTQIIFLSS